MTSDLPMRRRIRAVVGCLAVVATALPAAAGIRAGAAKIDITKAPAGPVDSRLFAKALVIKNDETTVALITLDVVSFGKIGAIGDDFIPEIRSRAAEQLGLNPSHILFNASHCHGVPCRDVKERTFEALKRAAAKLEPVHIAAGTGREERIMENRRLKLTSGRVVDVRHAYSLPPDEQIAETGPVDPEIGVLRIDKTNGETLAVVYNFACHPIQGVPSGANTADMTGFSSQVIEDNLSEGAIAFFLQGCAGDINPISYKDVHRPRDAETLGNLLGLSALTAIRNLSPRADDRLTIFNEPVQLPRANLARRIAELEAEQFVLLKSLRGTFLNLKTFMQLSAKHSQSGAYPSAHAGRYLHEAHMGRPGLKRMDELNAKNMEAYVHNIHVMEELTRLGVNLRLLKMHERENLDAGSPTVEAEVVGLRIGDFVLVTFPGELTVRIGLELKADAPNDLTFVAGYTNGYLYYAPTAEQLRNRGGAQEDSDCILAPEWEAIFTRKVKDLLGRL